MSTTGSMSGNRHMRSVTRTKFVTQTWRHEWKVEKFSLCKTPTLLDGFSFDHKGTGFYCKLELQIDDKDRDVTLRAELTPNDRQEEWSMIFQDSAGTVLPVHKHPTDACIYLRRADLLRRIAADDGLVMLVEVSIAFECTTRHGVNIMPTTQLPSTANLQMLNNGVLTDVVIIVGHRKLQAHRAMLASRSTVLAAMFSNPNTEEAKNGIWTITDFTHEAVQELLKFIYSGTCSDAYDDVVQLLAMAQKYDIVDLKQYCEGVCIENYLTVDDACHLLVLADKYSAQFLRTVAMDFILDNAATVIKTDGWKELLKGHKELVCEMFVTLVLTGNDDDDELRLMSRL